MTPTAADEATPAAASGASAPAMAPVTAGEALRRAREARGLHIAALAATLKVPQSKLEALEADRYKDLPDATFARALARSMCRALKIEADPVLAMLPSGGAAASLDRVTPGLNQPFRERPVSQEPMFSAELLKRPAVLGVGVLLVAAVAVYAIPSSWIDQVTQRFQQAGSSTSSSSTAPGPDNLPGTPPAATETPPQGVEAPVVSAASEPAPVPQTSTPVPATASTTGAGPTSSTATPTATAPTPSTASPVPAPTSASTQAGQPVQAGAPAPGTSALKVRASAESWVEVVDAKGQVLLSRLLRPGDLVDVNGVAPLKLRVGNVSGTELVFRGQPVDLAVRARDNVARLELN